MRKFYKLFRIKGLILWLAVIALIAVFTVLFLDSILKRAFIASSEKINGAKVELQTLDTSIIESSLILKNMQWSDRENPMRNLFVFDTAKVEITASVLPQKKIMINNITLSGLMFGTDRKTSGALKRNNFDKTSETAQKDEKADSKSKGKDLLSKFGDIDISGIVRADAIPAVQEAKRLQNLAGEKAEEWNSKIKESSDISELTKNYEAIQKIDIKSYDFPKDLLKAKKDAETIQAFHKQVKEQLNSLESLVEEFKNEQKQMQLEYAKLKSLSRKAPKDLLLSPDSSPIDAKALMEELVGKSITDKAAKAITLYKKYKHFIPKPQKDASKPKTEKTDIEKGTTVYFNKAGAMPRLYVEQINLSGSANNGETLTGVINGASSDLSYKPVTLALVLAKSVTAAPYLNLFGEVGLKDNSVSTDLNISANSLPLADMMELGKNPVIESVSGNVSIDGKMQAYEENISLDVVISSPLIGIDINQNEMNAVLADLLRSSLGSVKNFSAHLTAEGTLDNYTVRLTSNLQDIIGNNIKAYADRQLKNLNAQIQKKYEEVIGNSLADTGSSIDGFSLSDANRDKLKTLTQLDGSLASKSKLITSEILKQQNPAGQKIDQGLDKLKGKLPF
jgi:uncharacterized protein (TIGR03545 family)